MKPLRFLSLVVVALVMASPVLAREQAPEDKHAVPKSDKQDVQLALTQWKNAVESGSVDGVMKLYDQNAIMISTFAQNPMTKREEIRGYFKKVIVNPDIKVEIEDSHPRVFGKMAVNSGRYTLSYTQDGEPVSIPARFSFVYVLENGNWLIVDQHSSRVPLPDKEEK
jgi:uncharacterized protein (TIGR02246 family)